METIEAFQDHIWDLVLVKVSSSWIQMIFHFRERAGWVLARLHQRAALWVHRGPDLALTLNNNTPVSSVSKLSLQFKHILAHSISSREDSGYFSSIRVLSALNWVLIVEHSEIAVIVEQDLLSNLVLQGFFRFYCPSRACSYFIEGSKWLVSFHESFETCELVVRCQKHFFSLLVFIETMRTSRCGTLSQIDYLSIFFVIKWSNCEVLSVFHHLFELLRFVTLILIAVEVWVLLQCCVESLHLSLIFLFQAFTCFNLFFLPGKEHLECILCDVRFFTSYQIKNSVF